MVIEVATHLRLLAAPIAPFDAARKVDVITGDMVDYLLEPINTHVRWVDGSEVWRRVFIGTSGAILNAGNVIGQLADFAGLVRFDGYLVSTDGYRVPVNFNSGSAAQFFSAMIHESGTIIELHGTALYSSRRVILIIDYIPTPSDLTVWDFGTTGWDNGGTNWDKI